MPPEETPAASAAPVAPTGPVARDPLNPNIVIPIYLGGDGPVPTPPAGDRGDSVGTAPVAPVAPAAPAVGDDSQSGSPPADPAAAPSGETPVAVDPAAAAADPVKPAEKPVRNDKGQFIPRSRFNEVNEENKALKAKLAQLETPATGAPAAPASTAPAGFDFDAKEKEHANLVLDGKVDEAVKLRAEIRNAEKSLFIAAATQNTVETTRQMSVKERIDTSATTYEQTIPQFDPESEHYSEDLLADVRDFYSGALEGGRYKDPAEAFEASVQKALKLHGIAAPAAEPVVPAVTPAVPPVDPARTAQKRVEAIVGQPPTLAKVGTTGAPEAPLTLNVNTLTDADFARLPEATKRRLRGDSV
jgi:hypothetical protein